MVEVRTVDDLSLVIFGLDLDLGFMGGSDGGKLEFGARLGLGGLCGVEIWGA